MEQEKQQDCMLRVEDLHVSYHTSAAVVRAVNGISFSLKRGRTLGLVGETGAGKTTTALSIMGLLPERTGRVESGRILYNGRDLLGLPEREMQAIRGECISMIFQDPMTSLNPVMTIDSQIAEALSLHNSANLNKQEIQDRVDEILEMVGIEAARKQEYPHQFSGGMQQRVVIAIGLACNPELLIADEPTTALDVTIQAQVLAMLEELKQRLGTSMIMITHDLGVVAETCDDVAIMYAGEIVEMGSVEEIFSDGEHHPYTVGLFQAIPDLDRSVRRLTPIEGFMPDPANLPEGCKFHPRCPHCTEICKTQTPPRVGKGGHLLQCHLFAKEVPHD